MTVVKPDRPYFEAWLRRARRQFAVSGRLSQTAQLLADADGGSAEHWRVRLRGLLDGVETPTLDLLTRIDALLAGPPAPPMDTESQGLLFL